MALALGMVAAAAITPGRTAYADDWCWADPIISIEGHIVQILTGVQGSPAEIEKHVDEARIKVFVPKGVDTELLFTESPLYEETTLFKKAKKEVYRDGSKKWKKGDPIPVRIETTFKADKKMPAAVQINYGAASTSNGTVKLKFSVAGAT